MPIRLKIFVACLLLTGVTVALGLFGLDRQRRLGDLAVRMYDEAVMSVNFIRSAETKFAQLRGLFAVAQERQRAAKVSAAPAAPAAPAAQAAPVAPAAPAAAVEPLGERQKLIGAAHQAAEQSERQRLITIARNGAAASPAAAVEPLSERQQLITAAHQAAEQSERQRLITIARNGAAASPAAAVE